MYTLRDLRRDFALLGAAERDNITEGDVLPMVIGYPEGNGQRKPCRGAGADPGSGNLPSCWNRRSRNPAGGDALPWSRCGSGADELPSVGLLRRAQEEAENLIDVRVRIGELYREIPEEKGGDRKSNDFKECNTAPFETQKQEFKQQTGLSDDQAKRYQRLANHPEAVQKAKRCSPSVDLSIVVIIP